MLSLLWKVTGCVCLVICAVLYGHSHFYRDPGSVFFDRTLAYEQRYSRYRKDEVQRFVDSLADSGAHTSQGKASVNASLCVAFSSVKRKHSQYLEITLGSLLQGLSAGERADLYINVLNAEPSEADHPDWGKDWIHHAIDAFTTYNVSEKEREHLQHLQRTDGYAEKGVYDYVYALQQCYATGTPYIGMFEDDILSADGWLMQTLLGLPKIPPHDGEERQWLFMRLFNQERSTGWASRRIGSNHEHWIIAGIGIGIYLPTMLMRRYWRTARTFLDSETIGVVVTVLVPALVILFFQSGKASLLPPSPGVFNEPFGCCSQAMIFPRVQVPHVIEYLENKRQGQFDLLLDDLATEAGLSRYALYPVQVQHIGLDSARLTEKDEAQAIWSMAFEDLNPIALRSAHQEMVGKYYGLRE